MRCAFNTGLAVAYLRPVEWLLISVRENYPIRSTYYSNARLYRGTVCNFSPLFSPTTRGICANACSPSKCFPSSSIENSSWISSALAAPSACRRSKCLRAWFPLPPLFRGGGGVRSVSTFRPRNVHCFCPAPRGGGSRPGECLCNQKKFSGQLSLFTSSFLLLCICNYSRSFLCFVA